MSCEQFKAGIREAAAMADGPRGDEISSDGALLQGRPPRKAAATTTLQEHLDGCSACRQLLADERSLLAAIDGELAWVANGDVRPSFLPRVRAAIEVDRAAGAAVRSRFVLWPAACAMAVACLAVVVFQYVHARAQDAPRFTAGTSKPSSAGNSLTGGIDSETKISPSETVRQGVRKMHPARHLVAGAENQKHEAQQLEVLVPPDERVALARFVVVLQRQHESAMALTKLVPETATADLASEPLEIAELKVAPLKPPEDE